MGTVLGAAGAPCPGCGARCRGAPLTGWPGSPGAPGSPWGDTAVSASPLPTAPGPPGSLLRPHLLAPRSCWPRSSLVRRGELRGVAAPGHGHPAVLRAAPPPSMLTSLPDGPGRPGAPTSPWRRGKRGRGRCRGLHLPRRAGSTPAPSPQPLPSRPRGPAHHGPPAERSRGASQAAFLPPHTLPQAPRMRQGAVLIPNPTARPLAVTPGPRGPQRPPRQAAPSPTSPSRPSLPARPAPRGLPGTEDGVGGWQDPQGVARVLAQPLSPFSPPKGAGGCGHTAGAPSQHSPSCPAPRAVPTGPAEEGRDVTSRGGSASPPTLPCPGTLTRSPGSPGRPGGPGKPSSPSP